MKALFWVGMVVLILGSVSLVVPVPRNQREGSKTGVLSCVENRNEQKVSPFVSAVIILRGAGTMSAGKRKRSYRPPKSACYSWLRHIFGVNHRESLPQHHRALLSLAGGSR